MSKMGFWSCVRSVYGLTCHAMVPSPENMGRLVDQVLTHGKRDIGEQSRNRILLWWGGSDPYHGVLVWSEHSNSWHSPRDRQSSILSQSFLSCCCPRTSPFGSPYPFTVSRERISSPLALGSNQT